MHKKYHLDILSLKKNDEMLFVSMLEILIDRNEHNDSGGYKGKYDVEIDRFAVYKQHVA